MIMMKVSDIATFLDSAKNRGIRGGKSKKGSKWSFSQVTQYLLSLKLAHIELNTGLSLVKISIIQLFFERKELETFISVCLFSPKWKSGREILGPGLTITECVLALVLPKSYVYIYTCKKKRMLLGKMNNMFSMCLNMKINSIETQYLFLNIGGKKFDWRTILWVKKRNSEACLK